MAKRKHKTFTYAEAKAAVPNLTFEDNELLEPIRAARNRVLANQDCEYSRRAVRDEAGCRMDKVIQLLPLIETLERGPGQDATTQDAAEMPPLPSLSGQFGDLLKSMHSNVIQFGNAATALMRDERIQEHERTKSALESQKNAAEFASGVMAYKNDEAEDTAHVMVADYIQLR
jgi:hypothetical protein